MENYIDVYFSRVFHRGETVAEVAKNSGERSFEMMLAQSVHTVKDLSVERGLYFSGIILTNKDKEHQKIMFLNVANDIPIVVGDIVNWENEKWIVFQKERKVNGTYQTFYIIRCNYLLKWIDAEGHLQQCWGYFTSSLDSKIKDNFRTWHNEIVSQPNKYAEIIMPNRNIARDTSFIVEGESWSLVEYDHSSVPGIAYLSLTEEKLNTIYDDTNENIADIDRLAKYTLALPENPQVFVVGQKVEPQFTIVKDGKPIELGYSLSSNTKDIVRYVDGVFTAISAGRAEIVVSLKADPAIQLLMNVEVGTEQTVALYMEGNDKIKLGRTESYSIIGATEPYIFSISNEKLAAIVGVEDTSCRVRANESNKLGNVILTAQCGESVFTKEITIVPLW